MERGSYARPGDVPHPVSGGNGSSAAWAGYPPAGTSDLLAGCCRPAANAAVAEALPAGQDGMPGLVAVPAHPGGAGTGRLFLEAREPPRGGRVLPVFSSVRRLVAALGPAQPWAVLPLDRARDMATAAVVERIVLDPVVSPGAWRWTGRDLEDFGQARRAR